LDAGEKSPFRRAESDIVESDIAACPYALMNKAAGGDEAERDEARPILASAAPSVPVMTGTHFHAMDEKGRIIIPAKLRPALTEQFWLILDENDNIGIYNYRTGLDVLEHCEREMAENPGNDELAAAVERITGAAEMMTVEGGWRVPIPQILQYHAELDKEVVTVGVLNHAVLWSREKWENAQSKRLQSVEVRRAQAGLLRAAASSIKKAAQAPVPVEAVENDQDIAARATGTEGEFGREAGSKGRSAAASAGDGRRSARVLTLSRLGR
jgi:MraZ protein